MFDEFGHELKLRVEGTSHAERIEFYLKGFPCGFHVDRKKLAAFMRRRAPGRDTLSTQRHEKDDVELMFGLDRHDFTVNKFTPSGAMIHGFVRNADVRPQDYGKGRTIPRPGHADFPQWVEMGLIPTGGGENSGRLTVALCAAGGLCKQYLESRGIRVRAEIVSIGGKTKDFDETIRAAQKKGDSVGGVVRCVAEGVPPGWGGALFEGVESELSAALFGIPGVKGVEFGNGFAAAGLKGSENNDAFTIRQGRVVTETNRHGGILGGRTTGMPIEVRVAFKPTPTVFVPEKSVDLATRKKATCEMRGRHDPCIVRRAVPVVEAMMAYALLDMMLIRWRNVPQVCLTLTGKTLAEDRRQLEQEWYFTDVVELRVDLLDEAERAPEKIRKFVRSVKKPVILTYRRKKDGGAYTGSEKNREVFFRAVLTKGCGLAYVDFEDDFRRKNLTQRAAEVGVRIIRSLHVMQADPWATEIRKWVDERLLALRGETFEIPKLAFTVNGIADLADLLLFSNGVLERPRIICAMGAEGFLTRALATRMHSLFTYTSTGGLRALGHVSPTEMVRTYRVRSVSDYAPLYGVTGWPLAFTRSPEINNAAFAEEGTCAVMVPMPAKTAQEAMKLMRAFCLNGMAVTYPHKQAIMPLLDGVSEIAQTIGAVNTVVNHSEKYIGYNTDADGFAEALTRFVGATNLRGRRVAVIGAGGAARAVVYALKGLGAQICIFNRTLEKAEKLATEFGCQAAALGPESTAKLKKYGDIIVQAAAPGGCAPEAFDPLAFYTFSGREFVYDLMYEPEMTPTLDRAEAAGCRVENGFSMLEAQARLQRKLYGDCYL